MARYRVQLYNVSDKHKYAPLPVRSWWAFWGLSWQLRTALLALGSGLGVLAHLVVR